jgi:hypothetical protein
MSVAYLCKYSRITRSSSAFASELFPERAPPSVISEWSGGKGQDSLCQRASRYIDREVLISNLGVGMKLGSNRRKVILDKVVMYKQLQTMMSARSHGTRKEVDLHITMLGIMPLNSTSRSSDCESF